MSTIFLMFCELYGSPWDQTFTLALETSSRGSAWSCVFRAAGMTEEVRIKAAVSRPQPPSPQLASSRDRCS